MSKKNFKGGLDSLIQSTKKPKKPRGATQRENLKEMYVKEREQLRSSWGTQKESTPAPAPVRSVKEGVPPNKIRATFIVDEALLEKVKALAYWERLQIKEVIDLLLQGGIDAYEKDKGKLKPLPTKR